MKKTIIETKGLTSIYPGTNNAYECVVIFCGTEITINIRLSELANSTNFNLAQWIGQNPHKVEFKSSTSKSAVAANLDLNADLTIAKQVSNTSLIIK